MKKSLNKPQFGAVSGLLFKAARCPDAHGSRPPTHHAPGVALVHRFIRWGHSFRVNRILAHLENGGSSMRSRIALRTRAPVLLISNLYDRTRERLTLDEIERIRL